MRVKKLPGGAVIIEQDFFYLQLKPHWWGWSTDGKVQENLLGSFILYHLALMLTPVPEPDLHLKSLKTRAVLMTEFGGARPCEFSEYLLKTQWKETRLVIMKGIPLKWSARQGDFHSG